MSDHDVKYQSNFSSVPKHQFIEFANVILSFRCAREMDCASNCVVYISTVVGFVLQHFGHALLIKRRDDERKLAFGSREMQVLQKWWDAMYLAQYVAVR